MTQHTPVRNNHRPQFRLQPSVLHLDSGRSTVRRRRSRSVCDVICDLVFMVGIPLLMLASVGVLIWILLALGRAVRSIGGIP